jgi:heterodisulfide reductase subunit C
MREWQGKPAFKYESELDLHFPEEVASMPGGRALFACIQCGTCSGTCPLSTYMDYAPRKIIAMTRAGFKEEVLHSLTIWLCASCYACSVECPRQIKIADFMAELKQRVIQEEVYPKRFPGAVLAREFFDSVRSRGRNTESRLVLRLYAKTNPLQLMRQVRLGLRLMRTGRFSLRAEAIRQKRQLQKLLSVVDAVKGTTAETMLQKGKLERSQKAAEAVKGAV